MPMSIETMRAGASLVTSERPTGDKKSSPMVRIHTQAVSHHMLTICCSPETCAAKIMMTKELPRSRHPIAILAMLEGSLPRLACQDQKLLRSGVKKIIMAGLKAWNQEAGISHPKTCRFVS